MKKGKAKNDQMIINGTLSGESVRILIDTGASLTFISGTFLKKHIVLQTTTQIMKTSTVRKTVVFVWSMTNI